MRKVFVAICLLLLVAESLYFASQASASLLRIRGERAFYRKDNAAAWQAYSRALTMGGDRNTLELDRLELLLFGLDLEMARLPVEPGLPPDEALVIARTLAASRIAEMPYAAYYWALAADVYLNQAQWSRHRAAIDISALSEDPLANLAEEERIGIAALERAAALEPDNYLYHDILARTLLEYGAVEEAALHVRRAVAACPSLDAHRDLTAPGVDPRIVEAAVQGFIDARGREALVLPESIEEDAGRLLRHNGQVARAVEFLQRAITLAPDLCDAQFELGVACDQLGDYACAVRHLEAASRCGGDSPEPHHYLGAIHRAAGDLERAIKEFRQARAEGGSAPKYLDALGEALEASGAILDAERQFVAAAHLHPEATDAWRALVGFYARHRDLAPLPDACARLAALAPGDPAGQEWCASLGLELR